MYFSPWPEDGLEFTTLWCRSVCASCKEWKFQLRDFPQPLLDIRDLHIWGRLVGAEQEATRRGKVYIFLTDCASSFYGYCLQFNAFFTIEENLGQKIDPIIESRPDMQYAITENTEELLVDETNLLYNFLKLN